MLNVGGPMAKPSARVYPTTLVLRQIVDPNVLKARSVYPVWRALIKDAPIPVLAPVPTTLFVTFVITCPVVSARLAM